MKGPKRGHKKAAGDWETARGQLSLLLRSGEAAQLPMRPPSFLVITTVAERGRAAAPPAP